jgi:CBS domain-containing protein
MTTVKKLVRNVVAVYPEHPLDEAWRLLRDQGLGSLPVVDAATHVVGVLGEDDLLVRHVPRPPVRWWTLMAHDPDELANRYRKAAGTTVGDVMSTGPAILEIDATVADAAALLHDRGLRMVPVVAGGVLTRGI